MLVNAPLAVAALLVRLGSSASAVVGTGPGADVPYRWAFVALAVILAAPVAEAAVLPHSAGNVVTGRAATEVADFVAKVAGNE